MSDYVRPIVRRESYLVKLRKQYPKASEGTIERAARFLAKDDGPDKSEWNYVWVPVKTVIVERKEDV